MVDAYEPELMRLLAERGYGRPFLAPRAFLDVAWSSFDGYLAFLRSRDRSYRWQVKRQIERTRVLAAFQAGRLLGFQLLLCDPRLTDCALVGIDREQAGRSFACFNLVYYRPIQDAIAEGSRRICFGKSLEQSKARRGCRFHRIHPFHLSPHRLRSAAARSWLALFGHRTHRKVPPGLAFPGEPREAAA